MAMMIRNRQTKKPRKNKTVVSDPKILSFNGHVQELRQRLVYIVGFLVVFTGVGYIIREQLIEILVKPAEGQQFIYTSPVGGFDFIFRISLYFGLALSVPVLMYNLFQYLAPLLPSRSGGFVFKATLTSYILAIAGVCFGYFASLPAALNFLLHQFGTNQIQALLSIQEYMSFVMVYLVGFALLFQIPIILLFINRITPLKPRQLFGYQRYVIVGSAVLAAVLTPTADIVNMLIMAVPIIFMYQFGVVLVMAHNRRRNKQPAPAQIIHPEIHPEIQPQPQAHKVHNAHHAQQAPEAKPHHELRLAPTRPVVTRNLRSLPLNRANVIQ
jgi:sec-independent protein translocase protein TatC